MTEEQRIARSRIASLEIRSNPDRRAYIDDWQRRNRAKTDEYKRRWAERNKQKRAAHVALNNAVRDRRIDKGTCEICGTSERVQAHHEDYAKPLEVRWLCITHHGHTRRKYEDAA